MRTLLLIILGIFLFPSNSYADSDKDQIKVILAAIISGWENADGAPFRKHFLDFDGARYIESGGQNVGLSDLIDHHVEPEGKAIKLDLNFTKPDIHIEGNFAWVVLNTEVLGTIIKTERKIHNKGYQTIILRKINDAWKVIHTHSSGRPVKKS